MCLESCAIGGISQGAYDDAEVVFDVVLPSQRPVVGSKRNYDIDVRTFLASNAVLTRVVSQELLPFAESLDPHGRERLRERAPGCFDFRARVVVGWVLQNIRYRAKDGRDPWQFPDETLTLRSGDCEDIAFLAAALLMTSGVSGYHVRVALGEVVDATGRRFQHAWVLYKSESGRWRLIEPLAIQHGFPKASPLRSTQTRKRTATQKRSSAGRYQGGLSYRPWYLLNTDHLWAIPQHGHPGSLAAVARKSWRRMNPKFAGETHKLIVESALADIAPPALMTYLRGRFRNLVVATVDDSDWVNPISPSSTPYNPFDHFDNGCIDESWTLVEKRLGAFAQDRQDYEPFAQAIHAIADFYAHSSYLHFASVDASTAVRSAAPYPGKQALSDEPASQYDTPDYGPLDMPGVGDFDLHRFSKNQRLWKGTNEQAIAFWQGKVISGRYAQDLKDLHGSFVDSTIERLNTLSAPPPLPNKWQRAERGALPHHAEIAVDAPDRSSSHLLYDTASYRSQFELRVATAVRHVRQAFRDAAPY
jgi:hypothetical protein